MLLRLTKLIRLVYYSNKVHWHFHWKGYLYHSGWLSARMMNAPLCWKLNKLYVYMHVIWIFFIEEAKLNDQIYHQYVSIIAIKWKAFQCLCSLSEFDILFFELLMILYRVLIACGWNFCIAVRSNSYKN